MNQPYFILVLAHSLHGRLRRVHVPYQFVYAVLALAILGVVTLAGFLSSYARMAWKVANYNNVRHEMDVLRARYQRLEKETRQKNQQLASLQLLANEVSVAYGIKKGLEGPSDISLEGRLVPTYNETLEQYNFLKSANLSRYHSRNSLLMQGESMPSIWPVNGLLMSHFGRRTDPFSGEGAFHSGVDLSTPVGTPVKVSGDGVVSHSEWGGAYGRLVVVDHSGGLQTYYAHLSRLNVITGQVVRRGEVIGFSGISGRSSGPHLHYEVRRGGIPINPYPYLNRSGTIQTASTRIANITLSR
ncbi:MAG TPA: M23 family metallopeptidase [Bryobacteraceae bacterium]|nr:M23 family metallopeptidase [Bryobacteraceae bacterium]